METATTVEASAATKSSPTSAVTSRPRGRTECKQSEANYANYSFCFHTLRSLVFGFATTMHPWDFPVLRSSDAYRLFRVSSRDAVQASAVTRPGLSGRNRFQTRRQRVVITAQTEMVPVHQRTGQKSGHNIAIHRPSVSIEKKTTHGVVRRGTG